MSELEWIDIFSGNLRDIMQEFNISQNELARRSGLTKSMISEFVNGKRIPSIKSIVNICHALPELDSADIFESLIYFDDMIN